MIILFAVASNFEFTISSLLRRISKAFNRPLSTLKANAKILRELGLIKFGNSNPARLTKAGKVIIFLLNDIEGEIRNHDWR